MPFVMVKYGSFSCIMCAPKTATVEEVVKAAEDDYPSGTENGWSPRECADQTVQCETLQDHHHWLLDA